MGILTPAKSAAKRWLQRAGYDVQRTETIPPASHRRPVGDFDAFLEDVRARGFRPRFVLDVGANVGRWTRMAKGVFPDARFLLIEPQGYLRAHLDPLCAALPDVSWVEVGVGRAPGSLTQTIFPELPGASSFLPLAEGTPPRVSETREVRIVTIDSLLEERHLPAPDLVKMDIQGFELEALRGAEGIFGHTELLVVEVSLVASMVGAPLASEVVGFMRERGYEIYDLPGYFRRPLDGALGQVDIAFAKAAGLLRKSPRWE